MPRQSSINRFVAVTGTNSAEAASFFLQRNHGRVNDAINDYYNNPRIAQEYESRAGAGRGTSYSSRLKAVFAEYKEPELDPTGKEYIGIDGTMNYLSDLGYEPEDEAVLCIAELLESPAVGVFKEEDFLKKWNQVGCETVPQMKTYINRLKTQLKTDDAYFNKIYQFTYKFILEKNEKMLALDMAEDYWHLLIPDVYSAELSKFLEFLHAESKKSVSRDQWNMLLPFLKEYHSDNKLSKYDETQSWPLLMDEFYEYLLGGDEQMEW